MSPQSASKYLSAVDAFFDVIDTKNAVKTEKRIIFVATDDKSVIQEVILHSLSLLENICYPLLVCS